MDNTETMRYIDGKNLREIVLKSNTLNICKEDIVGIYPGNGCYYMIYYDR